MEKNKKIILIIAVSLIVLIGIVIGVFLIVNNKKLNEEQIIAQEEQQLSEEELENNFKKKFYNIEYTEDKNEIVSKGYFYEAEKENEYNIKLNIPQINKETEVTKQINKTIVNIYGNKLLDIINNKNEYTVYNADFITYNNDNIISIIIKTVLKEGSQAQRTTVETYNYDIENDKLITLNEVLKEKNIDKSKAQTKIINTIREKNTNTKILAEQGYNIYVRDIRSEEYLLENIQTFFIDENGYLYILFPYGNKNYTETMDVIILK